MTTPTTTPHDLSTLRNGLAQRAEAAGLLDVAWENVASPFGDFIVCATGRGVVRVVLPAEDADAALQAVADRVSPRVLRSARRTDVARRQISEYFEGTRRTFDVPVDWHLTSGFRREALAVVAALPYGTTATYREVAEALGKPAAVRAAGSACANNPVPVIVPCHRVLRTGGGLGGYLGGLDLKRALLALESGGGVEVPLG
jgi:methylated-DNA-[protein]-cysteine S-methyltransferase